MTKTPRSETAIEVFLPVKLRNEVDEWAVYNLNGPKRALAIRLLIKAGLLSLKIAPYASHLGNCDYDSWDLEGRTCTCGLFQLLKAVGYKETP